MDNNKRKKIELIMWMLGVSKSKRYFDIDKYHKDSPFAKTNMNSIQYTMYKHGLEYGICDMYINLDDISETLSYKDFVELLNPLSSISILSRPSREELRIKMKKYKKIFSIDELESMKLALSRFEF